MTRTTHLKRALALSACAWLAACGGDPQASDGLGSEAPVTANVPGTDVPLTATQSSAGAIAFIRTVVANEDESADNLRIDAAEFATSETDEPEV
jgi:ABC-type glycerol-3-phosphate transport system substrate-binding protein